MLEARSVCAGAAECAFVEMISNMAVSDSYVFILDRQYESADALPQNAFAPTLITFRRGWMHGNPRFWALFVAIWLGLALGVINIVQKINLLMSLADHQ